MIAFVLTTVFVAVAAIASASLIDSAVRGFNAWRTIQQEMAAEQSDDCLAMTAAGMADVVAFHDITPVRAGVAPLFSKAANQTAASAPTAAAA